jgi:very-short-patch-repair endonuclease
MRGRPVSTMFRLRPSTNPKFTGYARSLRKAQTPHEQRLWTLLRSRRFIDFKFRRQVPIGAFIADFACVEAQLIIELDGSQHADDPRDGARDAELQRRGFRVLRFWNNELTMNEAGVLEAIYTALRERAGND